MKTDEERYCECMEELLVRIRVTEAIFKRGITTGHDELDAEIVFLQFRKMLEQLAFASLVANKASYATARTNFADDWHAEKILSQLEKLNSNFYPSPLRHASQTPEGTRNRHHFEPVASGFLTKDDFVRLYNHCGNLLHARNPYRVSTTIHVGYSAKDWLLRIENLVKLHKAQLVTGSLWLCVAPDLDGKVHTYSAEGL